MERRKDLITRTMAGIELRLRISISQPIGKFGQFIRRLVVVEDPSKPVGMEKGRRADGIPRQQF